jgi:hypothetical protein
MVYTYYGLMAGGSEAGTEDKTVFDWFVGTHVFVRTAERVKTISKRYLSVCEKY